MLACTPCPPAWCVLFPASRQFPHPQTLLPETTAFPACSDSCGPRCFPRFPKAASVSAPDQHPPRPIVLLPGTKPPAGCRDGQWPRPVLTLLYGLGPGGPTQAAGSAGHLRGSEVQVERDGSSFPSLSLLCLWPCPPGVVPTLFLGENGRQSQRGSEGPW